MVYVKNKNNIREFTYADPIMLDGKFYPSAVMPIEGDNGLVSNRRIFATNKGYYSIDGNEARPIIQTYNLPEVTVSSPRLHRPLEATVNDQYINSTDNTQVLNAPHREYNQHLKERAINGANAYAAWRKENPNAAAWGDALAAAPFAVMGSPLFASLGEAGAAAAATNLGRTVLPYANAALTSYFGANGIEDIKNGNADWSTALDIAPMFQLGKPMMNVTKAGVNYAKNWRPWIPETEGRYYRIVGAEGNPIGDAIETGVIRGPGMNPDAVDALEEAADASGNRFNTVKTYEYPMFAKDKLWTGSTARVSNATKPYVIRSKADTGPIVWEESNKDFRHKGHNGIFRPSYFGDVNASPTKYFEYYEPKRLGYMRKDFPADTNPYHNLMGEGVSIDRGNWVNSNLGVLGERFGNYIGSGGEQTVFSDTQNPYRVLKVYNDTYVDNPHKLKSLVDSYLDRNAVPLQQPASFEGYIKKDNYLYPVFGQDKLNPLGDLSSAEFNRKYLPKLKESLKPFGFVGDGINSEFTNGINTLTDIKPDNIGINHLGQLRFFDVNWIN